MLLLVLLSFLWNQVASASPKVLLLNSYHPEYKWSNELTRGIQQSLSSQISPENFYTEFMDQRRFSGDPDYINKFTDLLKYKYKHNKPELVIVSDDAAYSFMLEFGDTLFPNVPIVFCGVNLFDSHQIENKTNVTGIAEGIDIQGNLALIQQLHPKLNRIIMLGDSTGFGMRMVDEAKSIQEKWQKNVHYSKIKLEIWDTFSLKELYEQTKKLPQNTAVLMLAIHKDKLGEYFSYETHLPILSHNSSAPIYGMWGGIMIDNGVVGGQMNDPFEHGFNTGKLALSILSGVPPAQIPMKKSAVYSPRFDYTQLQRFNIDLNLLPKNSILFNQPVFVYQEYRLMIISVLLAIVVLIILVIALLVNIKKRMKSQKELQEFNQKLDAIVKERTFELEQRNLELNVASTQMKKLAHTDSLTGLHNRRAAEKSIAAFFNRNSIDYKPFTVVLLDIDNFKMVNDTYGHLVGDLVLKSIGQSLAECIRPSDEVYRWGGEEFLVTLPDTPLNKVTHLLQRLSDNINKIRVHNVGKITVSIGVSEYTQSDDFDSVLKRADDALYEAKANGRNTIVVG